MFRRILPLLAGLFLTGSFFAPPCFAVSEREGLDAKNLLRNVIIAGVTEANQVGDITLATVCPTGCLFSPPQGHVYYYDQTTAQVCHIVHGDDFPCYGNTVKTLTENPYPTTTGVPDCPRGYCAVDVRIGGTFYGFLLENGKACRHPKETPYTYCKHTSMKTRSYTAFPSSLSATTPICDACTFIDQLSQHVYSMDVSGAVCHWRNAGDLEVCGGGHSEWMKRNKRNVPGTVSITNAVPGPDNMESCDGCDFGVLNQITNSWGIYRYKDGQACHYQHTVDLNICGQGGSWTKRKFNSMPLGLSATKCNGCMFKVGSNWYQARPAIGAVCTFDSSTHANACNVVGNNRWLSLALNSFPAGVSVQGRCPTCAFKSTNQNKYQNGDICLEPSSAPLINADTYYYIGASALLWAADELASNLGANSNGKAILWSNVASNDFATHWRFIKTSECANCFRIRGRKHGWSLMLSGETMITNINFEAAKGVFEISCVSSGYITMKWWGGANNILIRTGATNGAKVYAYDHGDVQNLAVREVDAFNPIDRVTTVVNKNEVVETLTEVFYGGMMGATDALPMGTGALAKLALMQVFPIDPLDVQLENLRLKIISEVDKMITDAIIKEKLSSTSNELSSVRSNFLNTYTTGKKRSFGVLSRLSDLENSLTTYVTLYEQKMTGIGLFRGTLPTDEETVKLAQRAFRYLKIWVLELFNMVQELVLIKAYQDLPAPPLYSIESCEEIFLFLDMDRKIASYIQYFTNIQNLLLTRRVAKVEARLYESFGMGAMCLGGQDFCGMYTADVVDPGFVGTVFYHQTYWRNEGHRVFDNWANGIGIALREELTFDMKSLSYEFIGLKQHLKDFKMETVGLCRLLRSNSTRGLAFRTSFLS